jgi:hypothetical protein
MATLAFHPTVPTDSTDANLAVCPACHTVAASLTMAAVLAGAAWRCTVCAQHWDLDRLRAVANYAAWVAAHTSAAPAVAPSHASVGQ